MLGLARLLAPSQLLTVVNTGDDFEHLGLHISPDLDTVMYTLAGLNNPDSGWGIRDESWGFMEMLDRYGGETWFRLGDRDLATHVERTRRLNAGEALDRVSGDLCAALGIRHQVLPMCNECVRTRVLSEAGDLAFQEYFVKHQCLPRVRGVEFRGRAGAAPHPRLLEWLASPELRGILICPSNPFLSIEPILSLPGLRRQLASRKIPLVAVSPIVGGKAIKGPAAKIMADLGMKVSATGIAEYYGDLLDGIIVDTGDRNEADEIRRLGISVVAAPSVMRTLEDRVALARRALLFIDELEGPAKR